MLLGGFKSIEDGLDITSLLHRDDSQLILLVNPGQESLFVVVENTSRLRPVSVKTAFLQESVSSLEQEVVFDQL